MQKQSNVFISFLLFFILHSTLVNCQSDHLIIHLWDNGAPGFEKLKNEPEQSKDYWVKNIHHPSITVFPAPKEISNGTAVVICPGGGHRLLVYKAEGEEPALFLNSLGITAFVLKYRLARDSNSSYNLKKVITEDAYRAIRLIRSRAKEFNIDPKRLGIMGFSAGGEVVSAIAYENGDGEVSAKDPVERINGKPNFQIQIYPGPLFIPETVPHDAPPAFFLAADDDPCCVVPIISLVNKYRDAGVPFESHIYRKGGHGFNMGKRSSLQSIKGWPNRLAEWLADNNYFKEEEKANNSK